MEHWLWMGSAVLCVGNVMIFLWNCRAEKENEQLEKEIKEMSGLMYNSLDSLIPVVGELQVKCGFSDMFYRGKPKNYVTFWLVIGRKERRFSVSKRCVGNPNEAIIEAGDQIINNLNMDNLAHVRLKSQIGRTRQSKRQTD